MAGKEAKRLPIAVTDLKEWVRRLREYADIYENAAQVLEVSKLKEGGFRNKSQMTKAVDEVMRSAEKVEEDMTATLAEAAKAQARRLLAEAAVNAAKKTKK